MEFDSLIIEKLQVNRTSQKLLDDIDHCSIIYEDCLKKITHSLNIYHQESLSIEYYRIILGTWLRSFIDITYDHFVGIQQSNLQNQLIQIPLSGQAISWNYLSEAHEHISPSKWHQQLYVYIAHEILDFGNSQKNASFSLETQNFSSKKSVPDSLKWKIWRNLQKFFSPQITICNPYFKMSDRKKFFWFQLSTFTEWIWDSLDRPYSINYKIDSIWRKNNFLAMEDQFSKILGKLIFLYLPAIYLEGFQEFRQKVKKMCLPKTKIYYATTDLHFHSIFQFHIAENQSQLKLLLHQHGAGYGINKIEFLEEHEKHVSDYFYTWGWKENNKQSVKPLSPSPFQINHASNKKGIITILNSSPRYMYRFSVSWSPTEQKSFNQKTIEFLKQLPKNFDVLIRHALFNYGWNFTQMLQDAKITFPIDDCSQKSLFHMGIKQLVIVSADSDTALLEGLACNVPMITLRCKDNLLIRSNAIPYIEQLKKVKIIHNNPTSAAEHVKEIYPHHVEEWWNQKEVQAAKDEFVYQHARLSPTWLQDWKQEFRRVLKESE